MSRNGAGKSKYVKQWSKYVFVELTVYNSVICHFHNLKQHSTFNFIFSKWYRLPQNTVPEQNLIITRVSLTSMLYPNSLQLGCCPRCVRCLAPVAALCLVIQEERHLLSVGGWLLVAGMLWAGINLCVSQLKFFYQYRRQCKQVN